MTAIDPERYAAAVAFAAQAHAGQTRKQGGAPVLCHLLSVSALVLEHGGDADLAIAGLLHDSLEDCPDVTPRALRDLFGPRVAAAVEACTDTLPGDTPDAKSPWRARKERYLAHLSVADDDALLVSACDKRHNLGSLVSEVRLRGLGVLQGFNAAPKDQVWYYDQVLERLAGRIPRRLEVELRDLVEDLAALIQASDTHRYKKADEEEDDDD